MRCLTTGRARRCGFARQITPSLIVSADFTGGSGQVIQRLCAGVPWLLRWNRSSGLSPTFPSADTRSRAQRTHPRSFITLKTPLDARLQPSRTIYWNRRTVDSSPRRAHGPPSSRSSQGKPLFLRLPALAPASRAKHGASIPSSIRNLIEICTPAFPHLPMALQLIYTPSVPSELIP